MAIRLFAIILNLFQWRRNKKKLMGEHNYMFYKKLNSIPDTFTMCLNPNRFFYLGFETFYVLTYYSASNDLKQIYGVHVCQHFLYDNIMAPVPTSNGKIIKAAILIGGPSKGTRFRPLSLELPKPLFPIAGYPMIYHHIEAFSRVWRWLLN